MVTQLVSDVGEIGGRFGSMRVMHPYAQALFDLCDKLRSQKRHSKPRLEQRAGIVFAETNSGKSTAMEMYLETRVVDDAYARGLVHPKMSREKALDAQTLVIYVSISPDATIGSVLGDLLEQLGDPHPNSGTVPARRRRASQAMKKLGVELLVFDEIDHLKAPVERGIRNREFAMSAHNQLKKFMKDGYPVLFIGVPEAKYKLFDEKQIKALVMYEATFKSYVVGDVEFASTYRSYVTSMGISIAEKFIMKEQSVLAYENIYVPLMECTNGLFGYTSRFLQLACELAYADKAERLERRHLIQLADQYTPFKSASENPFREFDRKERLERAQREQARRDAADAN